MATPVNEALARWHALWVQCLPRQARPKSEHWQRAIASFLEALRVELNARPLGWWKRVRVLYRFQQRLARDGVPPQALRALVSAIILDVFFGKT